MFAAQWCTQSDGGQGQNKKRTMCMREETQVPFSDAPRVHLCSLPASDLYFLILRFSKHARCFSTNALLVVFYFGSLQAAFTTSQA